MMPHSTRMVLEELQKQIDSGRYKKSGSRVYEPKVQTKEPSIEVPQAKVESPEQQRMVEEPKQSGKVDPKSFAKELLNKKATAVGERVAGKLKSKFSKEKE